MPRGPLSEAASPGQIPTRKLIRLLSFGIAIFLASLILWPGEISSGEINQGQGPGFRIEAKRWPEAEKIFRSDPHWLGGDGASSVDLKWGRVLWLFGDSFIGRSGSKSRHDAALVRNSVAIQTGYDPTGAGMKFYWKTKNGASSSFFRQEGEEWLWPGSGIMIRDRLLIFLMKIKKAKNDLGFEPCGWKAVLVTNPEREPAAWIMRYLDSPQKKDIIIGTGSPLVLHGFMYAFSTSWRDRKVYLVRWPCRTAARGDLSRPQWWAGGSAGWVGQSPSGPRPRHVFSGGQTEFSVEYVPALKRYIQIQTLSLMNPCLSECTSEVLAGPWSARECFYMPAERDRPGLFIYAGKSHPALQGADMVFTYVVNPKRRKTLLNDMSVYYPVVLKGWVIAARERHSGMAVAQR
jgi:hypothetical protein